MRISHPQLLDPHIGKSLVRIVEICDLALSGIRIPGYEIKERSGAREIAPENINQAFDRLQMPPEVFLRACKVSITKLVEELTTNGLTKKAANQAVNDRLLGLVETKPAVKYLSKIK